MTIHRWLHHLRPALAVGALLALTTACAPGMETSGSGTVWVSNEPPARRYEARPRSPGRDFIWIEADNNWNGSGYDYVPGRWERRPAPRSKWVQGKWRHGNRGWYHNPGHWRN